jgi:hypothetical protein
MFHIETLLMATVLHCVGADFCIELNKKCSFERRERKQETE